MTFQPPPPPPPPPGPPAGGPPAGPPPGEWGPPPGQGPSGAGGFDPKSVNQFDWGILGVGALLLIFSFFDYYTVSVGPISDSTGGWHFSDGSFIGWFAFILGLAGAGVVALGLFMPHVKLPMANYAAAILLFGASAVLYILGFFIIGPDDGVCGGVSACEDAIDNAFGFGFSYWASLILVIAGAVLAMMRAQQTGATLPGPLNNMPKIGK